MDLINISWTNIIIALVALYGAVLSTYTLIMNLQKEKFKINVTIAMGFLTLHSGGTSNAMLFLSASNPQQRVTTLSGQGLILPGRKNLIFPSPQSNVSFPHELAPGKSCQIWIEAREIAKSLKSYGFHGKIKLTGFYRDQLNKVYKSKAYKFNIDEYFHSG